MSNPKKACLIFSISLLFTAIPFGVYGQETNYSLAEEGKLDKFFLGLGTANVNFKGAGALSLGLNVFGGARFGLYRIFFFEVGYGTIFFEDETEGSGATKNIRFRTTGPFVGFGALVPVRKMVLGFKILGSFLNRFSKEVTDEQTGNLESNTSGDINFISFSIFTQLFEVYEIGFQIYDFGDNDAKAEDIIGIYGVFTF